MILLEVENFDGLTASELDRALEVAQNWGGWSFEEAELMARALVQLAQGASLVRVRAPNAQPVTEEAGKPAEGKAL